MFDMPCGVRLAFACTRARPFLCREPKRPGDPIANVYWQKFAVHVQALADKSGSVDGTGKAGDY